MTPEEKRLFDMLIEVQRNLAQAITPIQASSGVIRLLSAENERLSKAVKRLGGEELRS
jgi:hypothetical protein